jgi:ABC-2 type transport system permease protein
LIGLGLPGAGAISLGLAAASGGWVFATVGGLIAQMTQSPGPARGIGLATFALPYGMRAIGDLGDGLGWLSWLSPLGWMRFTRALRR